MAIRKAAQKELREYLKRNANEPYPNDTMPEGMTPEDTCLEVYQKFLVDPAAFLIKENGHG